MRSFNPQRISRWLAATLVVAAAAGCQRPADDAGIGRRAIALRGDRAVAPVVDLDRGAARRASAAARLVLRGDWGSEPGAFGMRVEASRPGPMSLAVDRRGMLHLLDQVNRRIVHYDRAGSLLGQTAIDFETTEDIAVAGGSLFTLVYRRLPVPHHLVEQRRGGLKVGAVEVSRALDLPTGIFATAPGDDAGPSLWIERRHDRLYPIVDRGRPLLAEQQLARPSLGRPCPGEAGRRLTASRLGAHEAVVLEVGDRSARQWVRLRTGRRLLGIVELAADRAGNVFVAVAVADELGPPDFELANAERLMVVLSPGPDGLGYSLIPLRAGGFTDCFRCLAVGHDGGLYQMVTSSAGVEVWRWPAAPPLARAAGAGAGR